MSELVLALDAGGTKTSAWLVEFAAGAPHRVVGRGRSTAANPTSVGIAEATRAVSEAIGLARDDAGRPSAPITRAVLSIAGTIDPAMRDQFRHWARSTGLAQQAAFVPDFLPVLAAGTPHCCGVALISGTGSSAFGRARDGRTSLCGGWGYLLGDEGSGYAIGRAAIRGALDDEEANIEPRPLTAVLLPFLQAASAKEFVKVVYRSPDPRAMLASLAPLVIGAAEKGDAFAATLVDQAAHDLAKLAARAARAVGLAGGSFTVAVTGGVLLSSTRMQQQLRCELQTMALDGEISTVPEPLEGCLRLADPQFSEFAIDWN